MSATENEGSRTPRLLPMVRLDGIDYFIDERLEEFRAVWNPHYRAVFRSAAGMNMLLPHRHRHVCGPADREFGVVLTPASREDLVYPRCQMAVTLARIRPPRCG